MSTLTIDKTKDWTVEDYLLLGEFKTPCQLINGELIMSPAPAPLHQRVLRKLFKIVDAQNLSGELFFAPIDLYVDNKNVFQPDLVYLSPKHTSSLTERGIEGPVDLVVEIISPSNSYTDRNQKKKKYLEFGVTEYWIVDPANETIEIYTPARGQDIPVLYLSGNGRVKSNAIPSVSFELEELF
ncbi:MAG: Uma2 family endonuclease [Chryseotalea sp. WA131a]|jgi:Uma2 family endonuclease|nr:MAG: Uma2 family endonuclease [Chryseotalea sp. WA131a]